MSTNFAKTFGNRTMTSFCDVTNSAHQIQMTTLRRWMKPPHEKFLRTLLLPHANKPKSPQLKYLTQYMVYVFYKKHIYVFLSVLKKTNTLHLYDMSGGLKTLKHIVRTTLQLAYHGCKNLTHTSKTVHAQRTQVVVTVVFTIRVTSLHRWKKQEIKICDWFLAYYTCGVKLLEYRYAQVWNIAKRRKQSPIGWFL